MSIDMSFLNNTKSNKYLQYEMKLRIEIPPLDM